MKTTIDVAVPAAPTDDGHESETRRCQELHRQLETAYLESHDDTLPSVTRDAARQRWHELHQPALDSMLRLAVLMASSSYAASTVRSGEEIARFEHDLRKRRATRESAHEDTQTVYYRVSHTPGRDFPYGVDRRLAGAAKWESVATAYSTGEPLVFMSQGEAEQWIANHTVPGQDSTAEKIDNLLAHHAWGA